MDISIIYVNYNTSELVLQSIASVKKLTVGVSYEIIVVDNNSNDNIEQQLEEGITFIQAGDNLGFGRANNLGAKRATGKYLFLLNGDAVLKNNAIKILFDFMEANPTVAVTGGNLFNINGKPTHSYLKMLPSLETIYRFRVLPSRFTSAKYRENIEFNYSGKPLDVGYITGADFMVRRNVFEQVNGFDEDFFMYAEESELCHRISKQGFRITSVPQAEVLHLEGASMTADKTQFNADRYAAMNCKSQFLYFSKVYGKKAVPKYVKAEILGLRLRKKRDANYKEKIKIIKNAYKIWRTEH